MCGSIGTNEPTEKTIESMKEVYFNPTLKLKPVPGCSAVEV